MSAKDQGDSRILIRDERPEDVAAIQAINLAAFRGVGEAAVVARLRVCCAEFVSLVAEVAGQVVGHILFTPVTFVGSAGAVLSGMGLAPLAVLPEFQCHGVGAALCQVGLEQIRTSGKPFVVVLGAPGYYARFGFEPAHLHGISSTFANVPKNDFMIKFFGDKTVTRGETGVVHYHPEFESVS